MSRFAGCGEKLAQRFRIVAKATEGEGEVGPVRGHDLQQVLREREVAVALRQQAELAAEARGDGLLETLGREKADRLRRQRHRLLAVWIDQRQQSLRQPARFQCAMRGWLA